MSLSGSLEVMTLMINGSCTPGIFDSPTEFVFALAS